MAEEDFEGIIITLQAKGIKGGRDMTIHEFGKENRETIVLIHPSVVMWDYFEYVIPLLEKRYHLIIPALPGYDPDKKSDFTSVEKIAEDLTSWLEKRHLTKIHCIYGCSMGGAVVIRTLLDRRLEIRRAIIDGGITPYQLPWILTRMIAVKDFLLVSMGKIGGIRLLEKAFATDELSEEDIKYEANVLSMISYRTIWNTFDSCNNYRMPKHPQTNCRQLEYWYSDGEVKERRGDIGYMKKVFPRTEFRLIRNAGHGGLAPFQPERLARGLMELMESKTQKSKIES